MQCYQNDTDYQYMYWYKKPKGETFQLIVYLLAGTANFESEFNSGFEAVNLNDKQWSLKILSVQEKDEAVYLCAASLHSAVADLRAVTKTSSEDAVQCSDTWLTLAKQQKREGTKPNYGEDDVSDFCNSSFMTYINIQKKLAIKE